MIIDRLDLDRQTPLWFAMQATQRREVRAQELLREDGVESFVPMSSAVEIKGGRKSLVVKPAIANLMFVHASINYMQDVKLRVPFLQFKYTTEGGLYRPMVVPEKQMEDFIKLYDSTPQEELTFLDPSDPALLKGERVKIHSKGSMLDGVEGRLVKIKGRRNRQLSISAGNLITVVAAIDIDLVEVIKEIKQKQK